MDEDQKIKILKQEMTGLWVKFHNEPRLVQIEETKRKTLGLEIWDGERDILVDSISENFQIPLGDFSPLMMLSALDKALADFGKESAGRRVQPTRHDVAGCDWLLAQRPIPLGRTTHSGQTAHARNWLKNHLIVPERFPPYPSPPPEDGNGAMRIAIAPTTAHGDSLAELCGNPLRVWVGTFPDGIDPHWPEIAEKKCTCTELRDICTRRQSIQRSLDEARVGGAQVVILPELAVCPTLRDELVQRLYQDSHGFLLVVPGSFHQLESEELPVNRTILYSGEGGKIFQHDKFVAYGDDKVCLEQITTGNTVTLWLTSIGVISLAICRDFCEEEPWVRQLWGILAPDWLLVPSMSFNISSHLDHAKHLHNSCGCRVVVANQWPLQPYPQGFQCAHGFIFGENKAQEITEDPAGRLKSLDLPGQNTE